jgi:hypothetical protein
VRHVRPAGAACHCANAVASSSGVPPPITAPGRGQARPRGQLPPQRRDIPGADRGDRGDGHRIFGVENEHVGVHIAHPGPGESARATALDARICKS